MSTERFDEQLASLLETAEPMPELRPGWEQRAMGAMAAAAAAAGGAGAVAGLIDCYVCGAPNGVHREGCFNCGSLLASAEGAAGTWSA